jgi:hypothetical protein
MACERRKEDSQNASRGEIFDAVQLSGPERFEILRSSVFVSAQVGEPRIIDKNTHQNGERWKARGDCGLDQGY